MIDLLPNNSNGIGAGDGLLGDDWSAISRQVHVRITGTPQSWGVFGTIFDAIASQLANAGWAVDNVAADGSGLGCTNFGCTIDIFLEVANIYGQAEIEQNIVRDLAGVFSVDGISVLSGGTPTINGGDLATVTVHTGDNTGSSGLPSVPGQSPSGSISGGSSALNSFASGLGISVPVVLLAGGVVLLLALKK